MAEQVDTIELMETAMAHMQEGRVADAEALCRQVLAHEADNPDAFYLLGVIEHQRGGNTEALRLLDRAIAIEAGAHWYHSTRAQVLLTLGDATSAAAALEKSIELEPDSQPVLNVLGSTHMQLGRYAEAAAVYRKLTALDPENPKHFSNLGAAQSALGQSIGAMEAMQAAIRLAPDVPEYAVNFALTLMREDRLQQALGTLGKVLTAHPDHVEGRRALGMVLEQAGEFDHAVVEYEQALRVKPDYADVHQRVGALYARFGQLDRAMDHWGAVIRLEPGNLRAASNVLMTMNYLPQATADDIFEAHSTWGTRCADPVTSQFARPNPNVRDPARVIRVGYISPDFRNHPIAAFLTPIFAAHDKDRFQPVGFSDAAQPDNYTAQLRSLCSGWHETRQLNDDQLAELVRSERIDVLVDLTGHTAENRMGLFARKPAPVQVSYLGYCNTTGMSAMDYILGDSITDPPGDTQRYTEKLIRLESGFACWSARPDAPEPGLPPSLRRGFITFGAFHTLAKINDKTMDLWARLLAAVPMARLLIWRNTLSGNARQRILDALVSRGIATGRLDLRSDRPDGKTHLAMYHDIDIAIDSLPWSGHTTSCESIWMGVPFITIRGRTHAGRMAASALTHAGAAEFVAEDEDGFVRLAAELASDPQRLRALRTSLRPRMAGSALCSGGAFTIAWETALRNSWRAWCASGRS